MIEQHNQNYSFTLIAPGFEITSGKDIYQSSNLIVPGKDSPTTLRIPFESVSDDVSATVNWGAYTAGLKYNTSYAEFKPHDLSITMVVPDRDWRNRLIESVLYEINHVKVSIPVNDKRLTYCSRAELSSVDFKDNPYVNGIELNTKFTIMTPFVSKLFSNQILNPDDPVKYGTLADDSDNNSILLPVDISKNKTDILQQTGMGKSLTVNNPTDLDLITSLFNHIVYGDTQYNDTSKGILDNGLLYDYPINPNYDVWNLSSPSLQQYDTLRSPNTILGLVSILTIL